MALARTLLLLGALAVCGLGCQKRALYEYSDESYAAAVDRMSGEQCYQKLSSLYRDDREIALRVLAARARAAMDRGDTATARSLARTILDHLPKERDARVRSILIGVCLPATGVRDEAVASVLRGCVASGDCPEDACHALAALQPRGAFDWIAPLLRHPRPEVRYEAALALSEFSDARARSLLEGLARGMATPDWPRRIHNMPLEQCRANIEARARALHAPTASRAESAP